MATLTSQDRVLLEKCLAWAAQQGYYMAQETAEALGRLTGREMYLDSPLYDSYAWRDLDENRPTRFI